MGPRTVPLSLDVIIDDHQALQRISIITKPSLTLPQTPPCIHDMKAEADSDQPFATSDALPAVTDWRLVIEQLRTTNEELQRRKADAEKDKELFRELYNRASTHAAEVTKENNDLLEKIAIAEGQTKDGLAMIRQTYEVRVKALEDQVTQLRGLNDLLTARDIKMQGDDIRRRAGEESDLRVENQQLRAQLAQLRLDYHRMERLAEQLGTEELQELEEQEPALQEVVATATSSASIPSTIEVSTVTGAGLQ